MKKAYLSIGALLAVLALSGCGDNTESSSAQADSSSTASSSSAESSSSSESSVSSESSSSSSAESSSSSKEDVFNYQLAVTAPVVSVYEVGDTLDFASITVTLTTYKNGEKDGEATLAREKYVVKVGGQTIESNFIFSEAGEIEFEVSSADHAEAKATFKVTCQQHFTITNGSSDKVVLTSLPERALPGDNISFGLTLLPGYYFEGTLRIVDNEGKDVEYTDDGNYGYSFVMPSSNIVITVTTDLNDFTIAKDDDLIGNVILDSAKDDNDAVYSAVAGTALKFKANDKHPDYVFTTIFVDGVATAKGDDGYYHFNMPHHPVTISADKGPRDYELTTNAEDLKVSTVLMYKDAETKEAITEAHKGEKVFIKMSYEVRLVKYNVSILDNDGDSIAVTQDTEDETLFSFTMVSSDLTIDIKEDDWSKYAGYHVVGKTFKGTFAYGSSYSRLNEYTYDKLSSHTYSFDGNGNGMYDSYSLTWNTVSNRVSTEGKVKFNYNSSYSKFEDCEFFYSSRLFMTLSSYKSTASSSTSKFTDGLSVGTWDENAKIHVVTFNKTIIAWIQDEYGEIEEKMLATPDNIYTNFGIYTDETKSTLVTKGADITTTLNAYIEASDGYSCEIEGGVFVKPYTLTATEDETYSIVFKDEEGNVITSSKNGKKVYMYGSIKEGAKEGLSIKAPVVKKGSYNVTTTAVDGVENAWYFTMPEDNVTASLTIKDDTKLAGHVAVGTYAGFNLCSSSATNQAYSSASSKFTYAVNLDGTFTSGSSSYEISEITNSETGTFKISDYNSEKLWNYDGKMLGRVGYKSDVKDCYVGVKLSSDQDVANLSYKVHWISSGLYWALEFYYTENGTSTMIASAFAFNKTFYLGATFEMTGTSTEIDSTATYNVNYGGKTIYTVDNSKVTAVTNA